MTLLETSSSKATSQEVPSLDKRKVAGSFTLSGHGGHLGHVTWIYHWFPLPIDVSHKIWL